MTTLVLIYNSIISEKYRSSLQETAAVLSLIVIYNYSSYYSKFLNNDTAIILTLLGILNIVYVWFYTLKNKEENHLKFYILIELLKRNIKKYFGKTETINNGSLLTEKEKTNLLFVLVKIIYIPIMLNFTINNFNEVNNLLFKVQFFRVSDFTIIHWYKFIIPFIFLIDTSYFLFGYLFESRKLGSSIRSVDRSGISWLVTLACYPPLNIVASKLFPWSANQENLMYPGLMNYFLASGVLVLLFVYLSATISLGSKCSNLTNRGTVASGVYKYVRHPAYSAKVTAWWLMTIPVINTFIFINMFMWTIIYLIRALKEEDHLLLDIEYQEYYKKTPYRFIPKIF